MAKQITNKELLDMVDPSTLGKGAKITKPKKKKVNKAYQSSTVGGK